MTVTANQNFLQATGFKLVIDRKRYGSTEYFVQSVNHPSVSAQAAMVPYSRANIHMPADKLTFGELAVTMIADENLTGYKELYEWLLRQVNENYKSTILADSDEFPSTMDMTLHVLNSHNNTSTKIRYIDCVLTDLGDIAFQSNAGTTTYITFPASFAFTRFEVL